MPERSDWRARLAHLLPLYGHRNWILVADSAFPAQTGSVEVLSTAESHVEVLDTVLRAAREAPHVRPVPFLDAELDALDEHLAPGVDGMRRAIAGSLAGMEPAFVPHSELLRRVSEVAGSYHVLVLKTTSTVPYTTVFLELDCGYWPADREAELRRRMSARSGLWKD